MIRFFGSPLLRVLPSLLLSLLILGCSDDESTAPPQPDVKVKGVLVLNEGNFQRGNASLSLFNPDSGTVRNDYFKALTGKDLGDTGNSLTVHNGMLYLVVNGSNKIEVLNLNTGALAKTITSPLVASPRHIVLGNDGWGYITNLYSNSVSLYDMVSNLVVRNIGVGKNPEGMLLHGNRLFVANSGFGADNTVSVIALPSDSIRAVIPVGDYPVHIARLGAATAVVLCTGAYNDFNDPNDDTPGKLFFLDLERMSVTDSVTLGGHPQRIALDDAGYLYTVQSAGIQRVNLATKAVTDAFIPGTFYSLAFDARRRVLYATDPLDFVQPGKLLVYDLSGRKKSEHTVGIIPGHIVIVD